jgi:cytochrome b
MHTVRVWDLPLRVFHWTLVLLVIASITTGTLGGEWMDAHFYCGYGILALLLFRLIWGVVGSVHARFASFLVGPRKLLAYVKAAPSAGGLHRPGHNPLGGWSVVAMLTILLLQVASGLFSNDDIASEGPLANLVSRDWSADLTWFHTEISLNLLYALLGLHVLTIAFYVFIKKINLVRAMFSGDVQTDLPIPAAEDTQRLRLKALLLISLLALGIYLVFFR